MAVQLSLSILSCLMDFHNRFGRFCGFVMTLGSAPGALVGARS